MQKEIELVIPLGNGDPDRKVPDISLLLKRIEMVKQQTIPIALTLAINSNFDKEKLFLINAYADKIVTFGVDSYYAAGGIWNKIYTCWEQSQYPFVSWNGYDDYSSKDRFEMQLETIKRTNSNSCVCENWRHDEKGSRRINDGNVDYLGFLGNHMPFIPSFLLRKDAFLNSGISQYKMKCSYYFEALEYAYILKTGKPSVSKGAFFYYDHPGTLSHTGQEYQNWVKQCRARTNYSEEDCRRDWATIPFAGICLEAQNLWRQKGLC